jgi:hypothetical protein
MLSFPVYPEAHPRRPVSPSQTLEIFTPHAVTHSATAHPVSPLAATPMGLPTSVANKRLTAILSPLDATLTKNRGEGLFLTCNDVRSISFAVTFLATPHQLTPFLSHSYKNHKGGGCQLFLLSLLALWLFAQRAFHNSCAIKRFRTLSQKGGVYGGPKIEIPKVVLEVRTRGI